MIRLTAYVTGSVQRVGYRARVVSLAREMGLAGFVQNQPDGRVLVIAEGEKKEDLERFASAIRIENAFIHVDDLDAKYSPGIGQYESFKKITGSNEVGERLDDGIEILKGMAINLNNMNASLNNVNASLNNMNASLNNMNASLNNMNASLNNFTAMTKDIAVMTKDLTATTKDLTITTKDISTTTKDLVTITKDGFENLGNKIDQNLEKQDETIEEIRELRSDMKSYMDRRFKRIEADLAELKEMKSALKEKGLI